MPSTKNKLGIPTERIRSCIAESLAGAVKAYNLREVANRLGLSDGSDEEAFRSKRRYVMRRLGDWTEEDLLRLAQAVIAEFDAPDLSDLVGELTTHSERRLSTLSRREILRACNSLTTLFGEHPRGLHESLEVIAPKWDQMFDPARPFRSLRDEVEQHYLRNPEDWSHAELLQHCGALDCSQARFFRLIQYLVHPLARRGEEQKQLVARLSSLLSVDGFTLSVAGYESTHAIYEVRRHGSGVAGSPKNLIFASTGEKPEIVLSDAINNDVRITRNADKCLIYDRPLPSSGLSWLDMARWWQEVNDVDLAAARKMLGERLLAAVKHTQSVPEWALFKTYYTTVASALGDQLPALIPQVYLHYDPLTIAQRAGLPVLARQRMDFLLLLRANVRVVIEIDGKHHYAEGGRASPELYAEMVREDRALRLRGYEVYRFGAQELFDTTASGSRLNIGPQSRAAITSFFGALFARHGVDMRSSSSKALEH